MEWWTHLWLNEGFARFMQSVCLSHLFPEFSIWSQFVADVLITALDVRHLLTLMKLFLIFEKSDFANWEIDTLFIVLAFYRLK